MTQPLKQDERVLDYIYGELDEGERSAFEAQLTEDAALRAEVESLQGVSKAFRGLPKVTQSPDSVQRMTALLMQQAAQTVQAPGPVEKAAKAEEARAIADAGAKVIPLRGRTLRRIFASPASGIFAAAAAALFWVVLKSQGPTPVPLPNSPQKLEPVAMAPPPPPAGVPVVAPTETAKAADEVAPNAPTVPIKEAFADALKREAPASAGSGTVPSTEPTTLALASNKMAAGPKKLAFAKGKADLDSLLDAEEGKAGKKPMVVAMATRDKKSSALDDYDGRRFAQPPPPMKAAEPPAEPAPTTPTVRQQMAQAGDRRKDRIVEELANQELGSMPGRGAAAGAAAPAAPPPPPAAAAPEAENQRYAQAPSQAAPADEQRATAESPQYAQNMEKNAGRRVSNLNEADGSGSAMLQTVNELLQKGRCAEAHSTLTRIEQSFPATAGLAETRAHYLRSCQSQNQGSIQNQIQNQIPNQMQNQAPTPALQMPQAAPAPKPSAPRMDLEQAYSPSSRNSMPMSKSAAPAYRAKKAAPPPTQQQKARAADKAASDALY